MHNNFAANGKHTPAEVASDGAVLRKTGPMLAELRKGFNHDALGCKDFTIFPKKGRGGTDNPVCRLFTPGKWIGANKRTDAEKSAILKKLARRANGRAANDEAKLPGFRGDYLVFKADYWSHFGDDEVPAFPTDWNKHFYQVEQHAGVAVSGMLTVVLAESEMLAEPAIQYANASLSVQALDVDFGGEE